MQAGPGGDQQFAEAKMIATIGFDVRLSTSTRRTQIPMDLNIAIPIKRMIMDKILFGPDPEKKLL